MHDKPEPFSWRTALHSLHLWIVGSIVVADQGSKYLIIWLVDLGDRIPVIPGLNIVHFKNRGAAFGLFHDSSATFRLVFFGFVTLACIAFLVWSLGTSPLWDRLHRICLSLILGGALGNVKDRVIFQQVTDFIDVYVGDYHWPAFNIADSAISVGVCLLLLRAIPWPRRRRR